MFSMQSSQLCVTYLTIITLKTSPRHGWLQVLKGIEKGDWKGLKKKGLKHQVLKGIETPPGILHLLKRPFIERSVESAVFKRCPQIFIRLQYETPETVTILKCKKLRAFNFPFADV